MPKSTRRKTRSKLGRYWGYPLIVVVVYCGLTGLAGPVVVLPGAGIALLFMLFGAPTWCGAPTRDADGCRNNAYGLLLGCHLRAHKWANLKLIFKSTRWAGLMRQFWGNVRNGTAAIGSLASVSSAAVAAIALVSKH